MPANDPSDGAGDNGGIGGGGAPDGAGGGGYDNPGLGVTGSGYDPGRDRGIGVNPGYDQAQAAAAAMGQDLGGAVQSTGLAPSRNTMAAAFAPLPLKLLSGIINAFGLQAPNHISLGDFMTSMFRDAASLPGVLSDAFSGFPGNVTHSTDMTPSNAPAGYGGQYYPRQQQQVAPRGQQQSQYPQPRTQQYAPPPFPMYSQRGRGWRTPGWQPRPPMDPRWMNPYQGGVPWRQPRQQYYQPRRQQYYQPRGAVPLRQMPRQMYPIRQPQLTW